MSTERPRNLFRLWCWGILLAAGTGLLALGGLSLADEPTDERDRAVLLEIDGAIGPATTDYLRRNIERAEDEEDVRLVIIRMDTPGGLVAATRDIVQAIRGSSVPVAVWVAPEGAQATSAGTFILLSAHVAAMAPATNVGSATPVALGGDGPQVPDQDEIDEPEEEQREEAEEAEQEAPDNEEARDDDDADAADESTERGEEAPDPDDLSPGEKKALNDAVAWIRSLAEQTGRNADWAERAVRDAANLTARDAVEQNVADFIARDLDEVLELSDGREVLVGRDTITLETKDLRVERRDPDWRSELLSVITNPTVAYLLLMIGIYGLLLEGYSPGALLPGTIGAICLLLALYALQVLPVNYVGLLLLILGMILIVAEAFAPSFGVLGIGGIVAMVIGSIVLMDTDVPGFQIAIELIGAMALAGALVTAGLVYLAASAWRRPVVSGAEQVDEAGGEVITPVDSTGGQIMLLGERWSARSKQPLAPGTPVRVVHRDGLIVHVEPVESVDPVQSNQEK